MSSLFKSLNPQVIESHDSKFNGTITVQKFLGKYSIIAGDLTQSGGLVEQIWKKGVKCCQKRVFQNRPPKNILILGLGGGSMVKHIFHTWPNSQITALEIDSVMIKLGNKYYQLEKFKNVVKFLPFFLMKKKLKKRIEYVPSSQWNAFHKAYFMDIHAKLTKRLFLDYIESTVRFADEANCFPGDKREWKGETLLLGTRSDNDAFKYFERLLKVYPNSNRYIFEEQGGHHLLFLFPEKYTQILSQYLEC